MRVLLDLLLILSVGLEAPNGDAVTPPPARLPGLRCRGHVRGPPPGERLVLRRTGPDAAGPAGFLGGGGDPGAFGFPDPAQDAPLAGGDLPTTLAGPEPPAARSPVPLEPLKLSMPADLVERFGVVPGADPFGDVGEALLRGPEALLDTALRLVGNLYPRSETFADRGASSGGVTERLFEFERGRREERILAEFKSSWIERQRRSFSRFADEGIDMTGVSEGQEDVNRRWLLREQGKVLMDALRDTYLSKYKYRGEERIRDDALDLGEWRAADYVVLPPLVAGYVWWRGLEKRTSLGDTWLRISVEPLSTWIPGKEDTVACVSVEWGLEGFPVGLILSAGAYDGEAELDFMGIGTSIGIVRHALGFRLGD